MLARRLKELRFKRDITQADFAKIIGVAQQTVGSWEKGNSSPNYDILNRIANYFGVSTDYLLGRENVATHNLTLSNEQVNLLDTFDSLTADGKNVLWEVINSLSVSHAKTHKSRNIIQHNKVSGNNYFSNNNNSFNTTAV